MEVSTSNAAAERLDKLDIPGNVFVGISADTSQEVADAELEVQTVDGFAAWLYVTSVEALDGLSDTTPFRWVVVDDRDGSLTLTAMDRLVAIRKESGCAVLFRGSLRIDAAEAPEVDSVHRPASDRESIRRGVALYVPAGDPTIVE